MPKQGRFITPLRAEWLPDHQEWRLTDPLGFIGPTGYTQVVPAGFVTDFSSVPLALRSFAFSRARSRPAGALHDYHYRIVRASRRWADTVFYHALLACGVNRFSAYVYWAAVRSAGWWAWRKGRGA